MKFVEALRKIADPKKKFILAVSGGLDSCVLFHLFVRNNITCFVAHVNFQLRDKESDEDAAYVKELGESYGIPVYIKTENAAAYASSRHISIQMAAREIRYQWFEELRHDLKADYVVTAHHAGDQSETMLMNLIRGRGFFSLPGIPAVNQHIIRPLLSFTRDELLEYAGIHNIIWREDRSNATDDYERNYLRHHIIPLLKRINPSLDATMYQNSTSLQEASAYIMQTFTEWNNKNCKATDDSLTIALPELQQHPLKNNFLFLLLQPFHFSASVIRQIGSHLDAETGTVFHSSTHELLFNRNELIIHPSEETDLQVYELASFGTVKTKGFSISAEPANQPDYSSGNNTAYLDAEKTIFPLEIRTWRAGDSFMPLGMDHFKKLSDFFIDNKVPLSEKKKIPLLLSGGKIAWVAGFRPDQRFAITPTTRTILKITFAVPHGTQGNF
jgi:tRNA(Ile)-lysidine synthase